MSNILSEILKISEEVNNEQNEPWSDIEKRSVDTDFDTSLLSSVTRNDTVSGMPGVCRSEVWSCMSGVMEGGIKYVEKPGDIYR